MKPTRQHCLHRYPGGDEPVQPPVTTGEDAVFVTADKSLRHQQNLSRRLFGGSSEFTGE